MRTTSCGDLTPQVGDIAGLEATTGGDIYHWGALMAGALLGAVPVALVYSFFVEHYISAMTGAVGE